MARLRSAPSTQTPAPTKQTRPALKDRTNTAATKAPVYEDDGEAEGMIKDARPRRGQRKKAAHNDDEFVMAGGLGERDADESAAPDEHATTTDELAKSDGPPRLSMNATRRPERATKTAVQSKAQSEARSGTKKRTQALVRKPVKGKKNNDLVEDEIVVSSSEAAAVKPPKGRRSNQSRPERSDFSLSPPPPSAGKLHSVKRSSLAQSGSALRPQSTPAVESSILALKNFKRRPRQPSMLQMVQQRTASARPSGVNVSTTQNVGGLDIDDADLEDEDDFLPEAEGTPVIVKKTKMPEAAVKKGATKDGTRPETVAPSSAQSRKRKSRETEDSLSALDALKAKRQRQSRPAEEDFFRSLRESPRRSSSEHQHTAQPELTSDVQVNSSSRPSSTPPSDPPSSRPRYASEDPDAVVPSTEKEQDYNTQRLALDDEDDEAQDDVPNGTMAEPLSSSPLPSLEPLQTTQQTDVMADPLTQISPPRRKVRDKTKKEQKTKPLNTATLQALLPKRRQPLKPRERKSEYDIDSDSEEDRDGPIDTSHLDEDQDELNGQARRRTKAAAATKSRKRIAVKSKAAPLSSRKSTAPPSCKPSAASRKSKAARVPARTYGRGTASDKENEDDFEDADNDDSLLPDTSISMYEATKSTELEAARKKFAELDDWDMEFENVTVEEGRSSSQLWR